MGLIILALFIGVPIVEIAVFIEIGGWIGLWPTIAVVVGTAVAGTTMLRHQGLSVLARAQSALARQELPVAEIVDGVCLLLAGAFLLTPGFVTDAFGFVLMVPVLRQALARPVLRYVAARGGMGGGMGGGFTRGPGGGPQAGGKGTIDGEFEEVRPDRPDRPDRKDPGEARRLPDGSGGDGESR